MNILISIFITSLIWIIFVLLIYIHGKKQIHFFRDEYMKQFIKANEDYNLKIENLLHLKHNQIKESYEKGVTDTLNKNDLYVQITTWKEEIESATFFKNKKTLKVGYKYQLFSGGMPCFEPHIIIVEELNIDKLNEDQINRVFDNIEMIISNIPIKGNIPVKIITNFKQFAKTLLNAINEKKPIKTNNIDETMRS